MRRRRFLEVLKQTGVAAATAATLPGMTQRAHADARRSSFAGAMADAPWLLGYATAARAAFDTDDAPFTGRVPAGLNGSLYRNGPARHEIGEFRYRHWFDGDGMVHDYRIAGGRVRHRARMVSTHKYQAEQAAGRALYPGFGSVPPDPRPVTSPDSVNVANISVLAHHGKLLALWEAGSPWLLDPETLATRGTYAFSAETAGVPFSAHPRVERDGTLWNFGYLSAAKRMVFWHIDPAGALQSVQTLKVDPISMPHDFVVTDRHLVLMIPPLYFEPSGQGSFLDAHRWHGDAPTRVLIASKTDVTEHFWVELPAQWVFHYGNAWEDEAGIIRFDAARADSPSVMFDAFRDVMRGLPPTPVRSRHYSYRIDTRRRTATETPLTDPALNTEFPVTDPRIVGQRHRRVVVLSSDTGHPAVHGSLSTASILDVDSGRVTSYRYPDHQIPEEHLFVPAPGSAPETAGWVIGTTLNWRERRTELHVFDVDRLADGPVATAPLPYPLPLGLHGKFVHR